MKKKVNVGIVGLGKMGILHMGVLNALDGVKVKAIAEKEKSNFILHGIKRFLPEVEVYSDCIKMLDKCDIDVVYITTPTKYHVTMAKDCLERGIPFFVEKPLGTSAKECEPLIEEAKKREIVNMVGYNRHFIDTFQKAKELLDSGIIGEPIYVQSHMYISQLFSKSKGWRYKKEESGGGVLNTFATHLVDVLTWFFGDIFSVFANAKSYYSKEVEDFIHSYIIFENGLEGYMDSSWSVRNYRLPEIKIEVEGENGSLMVTEDYIKYQLDSTNVIRTIYKQELYRGVEIDIGGPEYTKENAYMMEHVRMNKQTDLDIFYAYKVQTITDAIYESIEKKKQVDIDYTI